MRVFKYGLSDTIIRVLKQGGCPFYKFVGGRLVQAKAMTFEVIYDSFNGQRVYVPQFQKSCYERAVITQIKEGRLWGLSLIEFAVMGITYPVHMIDEPHRNTFISDTYKWVFRELACLAYIELRVVRKDIMLLNLHFIIYVASSTVIFPCSPFFPLFFKCFQLFLRR